MPKTASASGFKTVLTLLVAAAVAALVVSVKDRDDKTVIADDDLHETVVVSFIFEPGRRADYPLHVQVFVEGVIVDNRGWTRSPYNKPFRIPRGTEVLAIAEQTIDGSLDCLISKRGKTVSIPAPAHRDTAGTVRCWYNKKS